MVAPDGSIDRRRLGAAVFSDPALRQALESIIHPLVAADRDAFLETHRQSGTPVAVLDIPLLFETGGEAFCDFVILCSAAPDEQRRRALVRDGMTDAKLDAIIGSQMPLSEKRRLADAVIETDHGLAAARDALATILDGPVCDLVNADRRVTRTMREIVLDTETTGINPADGHRIIEIGALELVNQTPTGEQYHVYINPQRDIDAGAVEVHGLTSEFLADKPAFDEIADGFLEFVGTSQLIIHNAPFDMGFINAELDRLGRPAIPMDRATDTLTMARRKFPGAQANLNALCRRFEIDNSHRDLHGALVDADLLASVYIELLGGRQPDLSLEPSSLGSGDGGSGPAEGAEAFAIRVDPTKFNRPHEASEAELAAHAELVDRLTDPVWRR